MRTNLHPRSPSPSRFNPAPGLADFWTEVRRPQPFRWLILALSTLPAALILYWAWDTTVYGDPERPNVDYITTLDPARTDAEIIAENRANQEVKELRATALARVETRKREMYKALGAATGMDVEEIERKVEAERAAEATAKQAAEVKRREDLAQRAERAEQTADQGAKQ